MSGELNTIQKMVLDDFPYPHTDVWMDSEVSEDTLVFGIPRHHKQGMAFYYVDKEGAERYSERPEFEGVNPKCLFHDRRTVPTKHFDLSSTDRIQFKCPECYLTRYRTEVSSLLTGGHI